MKAAPLVVVMISAAISVAAQPKTGKTVAVQIIVDSHTDNESLCAQAAGDKKLPATTVLVDMDNKNDVHHCVDGKLLDHDDEKKQPDAFKQTLVQLSPGDSITWKANLPFRVVSVRRHPGEIEAGAPHYPFLEPLPDNFDKAVTVGRVLDLSYSVVQRYKVTFEFQKIGLVDPDVVCAM